MIPSLLPPDDELELIHTRSYQTRVYLTGDDEVTVRGVVSDVKPPGLYLEGDPEELEIHQMHVELRVEVPSLEITAVQVGLLNHPHESCRAIEPAYDQLVGLSIARGFTKKVRELFGGPRGCTHTTALLQAMAPAVVQSTWSVMVKKARAAEAGAQARGEAAGDADPFAEVGPESVTAERRAKFASNINTCHIWAEDGEHVTGLKNGAVPEAPLQIRRRMKELGIDSSSWGRSG